MLIGSQIVKNGVIYDYCFVESIRSQLPLVDLFIAQIAADSMDSTLGVMQELAKTEPKIVIDTATAWGNDVETTWSAFEDRFYAICKERGIDSGWRLNIEADEVLHDNSLNVIKKAMDDNQDSYYCRRVNVYKKFNLCHKFDLWNLCGSEVVRLARFGARLNPRCEGFERNPYVSKKYLDTILIYHYGLMRRGSALIEKSVTFLPFYLGIELPKNITDQRNKGMFRVDLPDDQLQPIPFDHPTVMKDWIMSHSVDLTRDIQPI